MGWLEEIPENSEYQYVGDSNFLSFSDEISGTGQFFSGVANADGGVTLVVKSNGVEIPVTSTELEDGSYDYSFDVPSGSFEIEFIFPEGAYTSVSFKGLKEKSAFIYETFSNNSFDNPWTNVLPDGIDNMDLLFAEFEENEDILNVSALLDDTLHTSFFYGRSSDDPEYSSDYNFVWSRNIPVAGPTFEELWIEVKPEWFSGFDQWELYSGYGIAHVVFYLFFCKKKREWEGEDEYMTGIAVDLKKAYQVINGEISLPLDIEHFITQDGSLWIKILQDADYFFGEEGFLSSRKGRNIEFEDDESIDYVFLLINACTYYQ